MIGRWQNRYDDARAASAAENEILSSFNFWGVFQLAVLSFPGHIIPTQKLVSSLFRDAIISPPGSFSYI
jgi:hypothetical protein